MPLRIMPLRIMPLRITLALILCLRVAPAGASDAVSGTWGAVDGDGAVRCRGTAVLVFDAGRYYRVLPEVGSSTGTAPLVITRSRYRLEGRRVVVEPSRDLHDPEARQIFHLERIGGKRLVREGRRLVTFRPCPPGAAVSVGEGAGG